MATRRDRPAGTGAAQAARISDVARLARVSIATVSRALSTPDLVAAATRDRVLEAVRRTGYIPNVTARNLRSRRTMMVLVVVPNLANPFFAEVLHGVDDALSAGGYGMIIADLANRVEKEARYVDLVFSGQVDGVLLLNGRVPEAAGRSMADSLLPMAAVCARIDGAGMPQVVVEDRLASRAVVRLLHGLGHRRLAYVSGPPGNIIDVERYAGFLEGLEAVGLPSDAASRWEGDFTFASGAAAARIFLDSTARPTGVYAAGDEMAIGFLKTVRAAGVQVPGEVSVVGFDGIEYADFCEPTLTTIRQPRHEMGRIAAAALLARMGADGGGAASDAGTVTCLPAPLLVRDSTGPAPG